jgi:glycosyltransferase involved in cell wall biosynthesis
MEKQMKILFVSTSDASGGAARAAYRIHKGIQCLGVSSKMLVKIKSTDDCSVIPVTDFEPLSFFYRGYSFIQNKVKNKIQKLRWSKYSNKEDVFLSDLRSISIHGALQRIKYNVLHIHWFNLRFLNIRDLLAVNQTIIWTLHDTWAFTGICHYYGDCDNYKNTCGRCPLLHSELKDDLSYVIWKKKLEVYKNIRLHIVTPSEWLAEGVKNSSLLKYFPVTVIPNGLDTTLYAPKDKREASSILGVNSLKRKILFGAFNSLKDKRKGFDKLIASIAYLEQNIDCESLELIVFGATEPIQEIKTSISVSYLGYISDEYKMSLVYNSADIMVVPSIEEVFGQTASEAMACGVPVVAFNCTGIKEVVAHKITGYLAEPYSPEDLAKGIVWCLQNNINGELSSNARKKVLECYSIENIAKQYISLYKSIIGK